MSETTEKKLPKISDAVMAIADKISNEKLFAINGGVITDRAEGQTAFEATLPEGVTMETVNAAASAMRDFTAGATLAGTREVIKAMAADKDLKNGEIRFATSQAEGAKPDYFEATLLRDRKTNVAGHETIVPLMILPSHTVQWDSSKRGEMGAVISNLKSEATASFAQALK